jgi:hypothetical protein
MIENNDFQKTTASLKPNASLRSVRVFSNFSELQQRKQDSKHRRADSSASNISDENSILNKNIDFED